MKTQATICPAVLVAMAAVMVGCSSTASAPPPELAGTQVFSVQNPDLMAAAALPHGGGMKVQEVHNWKLVGPHYTLGIGWVATGQWIDAEFAKDLGIGPVRAPTGRELVVVAVTADVTTAAFKPSTPPSAQALVDGKTTPLPGVPLPDSGGDGSQAGAPGTGKLILLSAAPKAPVKLRVTDADRDQQLDLRTGAASGDGGYWQRQSDVGWTGKSPIVVPDTGGISSSAAAVLGAGTLTVSNPGGAIAATTPPTTTQPRRGDYAILNNYQDGWASPGQAFLTVPVPAVSGSPVLLMEADEPNQVQFNDAVAFSFTPANGRSVPADPATETLPMAAIANFVQTDVSTVVFHVPDNTAAGTVTFDLRKSQLVDDNGKTFSWTKPPQPFTLNLAFTR